MDVVAELPSHSSLANGSPLPPAHADEPEPDGVFESTSHAPASHTTPRGLRERRNSAKTVETFEPKRLRHSSPSQSTTPVTTPARPNPTTLSTRVHTATPAPAATPTSAAAAAATSASTRPPKHGVVPDVSGVPVDGWPINARVSIREQESKASFPYIVVAVVSTTKLIL